MDKRFFLYPAIVILFIILLILLYLTPKVSRWTIRSIDTTKYSRDMALNGVSNDIIEKQMEDIAKTAANYVAIGTPYDEQFYPELIRWVNAARKQNLKVWFRGNFSGWEGWFEYPKVTPEDHKVKLQNFLLNHQEIFKDEDIFTPCPECENGGSGDPRTTGQTSEFRRFLIEEKNIAERIFAGHNKKIGVGYFSMNADVAKLIMDKDTTEALGGIVTIDHYVEKPQQLIDDVIIISGLSGGSIVFGEIGVPIPDINGSLTEDEQARWLKNALSLLEKDSRVIGVNYWTNLGGSTQLWSKVGNPRKAVEVLRSFYTR